MIYKRKYADKLSRTTIVWWQIGNILIYKFYYKKLTTYFFYSSFEM